MDKKNKHELDVEINLPDLIKHLWEEKVLISSVSIICALIAFFYFTFVDTQKKNLRTEISFKIPSIVEFIKYKDFLNNNISNNSNSNNSNSNNSNSNSNSNSNINDDKNSFNRQILDNLLIKLPSTDNLESFVEQSKEFDNFKVFLKKNNVTVKQYFNQNTFEIIKNKNQYAKNQIFFYFSEELDGVAFLNSYVEFTKKKLTSDIQTNIKIRLLSTINEYEHALEIANKIDLNFPILKSMNVGNSVINEPSALFYLGTKVLTEQIKYFRKLYLQIETEKINLDLVLDKASIITVSENIYHKVWIGLIFGFFFSLVVIFFKFLIKER